jgi:hypothetical protein
MELLFDSFWSGEYLIEQEKNIVFCHLIVSFLTVDLYFQWWIVRLLKHADWRLQLVVNSKLEYNCPLL